MHFAVCLASRSHAARIGMHWKAASPIKGRVNKAENTMNAYTVRFNHTFGKMRRYKHKILYLRMSNSKPQNMVAMYAIALLVIFQGA